MKELIQARRFRLRLFAWQLHFFRPQTGLVMETDSDGPAGTGIAGSSALIIAINAALNRLPQKGHNLERTREVSQNIESQIIRVPTGAQDYYPAMYRGVNAIDLTPSGISRKAADAIAREGTEVLPVSVARPRRAGPHRIAVRFGNG